MNKIYKVIWSKAKHTYVVASEIAKGHTKGETTGRGLKKLAAAMLVAAALLSPSFAWAAEAVTINVEPAPDTATAVEVVYTKEGADSTFATQDQLQKDVAATNDLLTKKADQTALDETNANLAKKADQTALDGTNANLAKKADQTALDATNANLAKKADQTALDETNANLAKKANQVDLDGKADKATTLEGYGITDAYTKTEADSKFATVDQLQADVSATNEELAKKADKATTLAGYGITDAYTIKDVDNKVDDEKTARESADSALGSRTSALEAKTGSLNRVAAANSTSINESMTLKDKQYSATLQVNGSGAQIGVVNNSEAGLANDGGTAYTEYRARTGMILSKATNDISSTSSNGQVVDTAGDTTGEYSQAATKSTGTTFTYSNDGGKTSSSTTIKGNSVSTGTVSATAGITDGTTKDGTSVKTTNTVGQNLSALDTRITNVKEYLEKQTSDTYVSKTDAAVQDGAIVKADKTIGENVTNLDAALAKETAARLGADKAQDKVIEQVNQNMVDGFNTINKNVADGFKALNAADANEAKARADADAAEKAARIGADAKLVEAVNSSISLSSDNVLQKNTTSVDADGNVTTKKADVTSMILNKGNDNQITLSDKGIKVGLNSGVMDKDGFYAGGDTYSEAKAALKSDGSIKGADGKFTVNSANGTVSVNDQIELNGATGVVKSNGLNVGNGNMTVSNNGNINTVGTLSVADGNFKVNGNGGVSAAGGKTTLASDGSIKAADGKFTVNSNGGVKAADGKITLSSDGSVKAADGKFTVNSNGGVKAADGKITLSSDGSVKAADGKFTVNSNGAVKAADGKFTVDSNGNVKTVGTLSAADGSFKVDSTGKITSTGLDAGNGTIQTTGTVKAGDVKTGTLETTGDATIGGDLTVKGKLNVDEIDLTKSGIVGDNNVTASTKVAAGEITSYKYAKSTKDGSEKESAIDYDENGTSTWAKATDADGNWNKSTLTVKGSDVTSKVIDSDKNSNTSTQTASESSSVVSGKDGEKTYKSYITQNLKEILQKIEDGEGNVLTSTEQTETDITNTAANGTITNDAKALINKASDSITSQIGDGSAVKSVMDAKGIANTATGGTISNSAANISNTTTGDMTNTVGGKLLNDVTGDMENKVGGNLSTTVGGSQTTTVTGDSSLSAGNINNTAKNKITNKALDVETDAASSIVSKVSNDYGSNTSTQLSYQTTEEMKAGGKTATYLRGAAEEKSQLTDGDKKTTIDTVAGQTNTNITDGTNTSNDLQKADQIASSVTDGTNTTVVNQDAKSLASSITDGTKANNTNSTVDKSEQLIKASDTQYSATSKTATKMEDALVSGGSVIDVIKNLDDAANPLISSAVMDGTNSTGVTQTAKDITNTAKNGTIANEAKDITNNATENMTNTVGKDLTTTVGGNQTTTVTGDSSLKAENITNEAKNKITNKAIDVETDAASSIVSKVSNDAGSNTSTQLSYQTTEEMKADGKTASYLRGAAEEKSQLIDGDKKTTIDTIAGQTNTNITEGTNVSNSLQKADQLASSVTDGTNTTVVNQNAGSLASSITDGTKQNNTNNTVNKSEQLIKADDTHFYAETRTAEKAEEALKSGNTVIDIVKDTKTATVSSAVTDGTTITGISQNAKDISLSAAGGTITNDAKTLLNKASESITDKVGENVERTMTTKKISESVKDGDGTKSNSNTFTKTAKKDINIITDGTNTSTLSQLADSVNTSLKNGTQSLNNTKTVTEDVTKVTDENTGAFSSSSQKADAMTNTVKNGTGSNVAAEKALSSESKLTSGSSVINVLKSLDDAANPAITSTVTDGTNTTSTVQTAKDITNTAAETLSNSAKNITNTASEKMISQIGDGSKVKSEMTADGITNTAEGGTIYNKSKDILNEASGDILNFADGEIGNVATKITNITGDNTVTSDTNGTTFENKAHSTAIEEGSVTKTTISGNTLETGKATMDYAEVLKDLGVRGNAVVDGTSTLKGDVTMESNASVGKNLTVKGDTTMEGNASVGKDLTVKGTTTTDKLVVNNGATVTGGTTTDTLKVTGSSEFDGKATFNDIVTMNKGLSVTGGVTADTVTADSYKVGDKTYIDKDGINANNQVIRNVGQGNISEGSTDAVSGGQLYETNTRVSGLETRMGTVETRVDKLDNKIDKVGANAAAMANLHPLEFDEDSKWNVAAAVGSSGSETASAVGVFYRPNENVMVNASAAMGTGENMFGGGVSLRLGHGGNKAKEAQMKAAVAENKELRAKVDDLTARMDALLSVLNPNMSKDFPDVPENHWAYEAVSRLAGNGIVEGYEDGKYHGERQMTRYEMAEIIYNALSKGAKAEKKLVEEFRPELQAMAAQKKA